MTEVLEKPPYMEPDKFRPMPEGVDDVLNLADWICGYACETCNQQEESASPDGCLISCDRVPTWAFRELGDAANAYQLVRHGPDVVHGEGGKPPAPEAADLLTLADRLYASAIEICQQRTAAEPWLCHDGRSIPFERAPSPAFEKLSDAANAYWVARHLPSVMPGYQADVAEA